MSAAVAAARPSQALRQRRETQRPRAVAKASLENGAPKEDIQRYVNRPEDILRKFNGRPPSLRIFLYQSHFRLNDSQETLSYASPMRELLDHVKQRTVPHNMLEELHATGVQFYDSCLIVEVHNFRSSGIKPKDDTNSSTEGSGADPFSIHNNNNFITPSPHATHPALKANAKPEQTDAQKAGAEPKADKDVDKENMPAPQKQGNKAKVATVVLFPTPQSHYGDITQLANTPLPDVATIRRNQAAARAAGNPPTPLTAVPPTPSALAAGRSPKRQKMILDENNLHEFESAVLNETCPKLYLEPTKNFGETLALLEANCHPNNQHSPPTRKTRKRTTAELAADEAEAADMQRYMLAGDEHQASNPAAAAGGEDSQHAVRAGANQQTFSRFKTLAAIKTNHEEAERRKKEEEARQAQIKRQNQQDAAEVAKRRELEANHQAQVEQNAASAMLQKKQEAMARQQQQQQQQALAMQMANANAQVSQTPLSATQPQFSSPVVRQQTPMAAAASPLNQAHATHPMGGTPMMATSSNHAAGSPARPPSAISHHPNAMARTASQQQHQNLSRTGTPQMMQGTPVMNTAMPARNISSTPTPRMNNHGSPNMPVPGATPIMMHTPQPGQNMTPEQMQYLQNQSMQNQLRVQGMQQANISPSNHQQFQQAAFQRANMQIQANGVPQGQNPQQYRQMLASRFYQQLQQQQQQRMAANISPQGMPQTGTPSAGATQLANMNLQQLRQQYITRKQQLLQTFGQNVPQQHVVQMNQMEAAIRQREAQQQQQQHAAQQQALAQAGQMNMQGIPNQMNIQGGGNPQASAQMQQYQQMLQQQRVQQQRQNQIMQMRQQAMQQGGQMNMNNMPAGFNVNNMGNMGNMNGMNMANMQGMSQGNMGMQGMQGMQGMNMGNVQGMNQQQMQQMMMMRQAQARAAMQQQGQQQQQQQQQGGDMNWSGV
jgi:transcription factor SPT20